MRHSKLFLSGSWNLVGILGLLHLVSSAARVSLAEVFHPWVRWEGPGSGFENSSGAAGGGVWKSKWVGPSRAQVGGPKLGPRGWAQAGPKWVGPGYTDLAPLGLRSKNKVFELLGS